MGPVATKRTRAERNVRSFYFIAAFSNAWFLNGVWILYWREHITYQEIAILELFSLLVGLLAEVPSGAIADIIGRKRVAFLGQSLLAVSVLFSLLGAVHPAGFYLGSSLVFIGMALISGSVEALLYDSLADENKEHLYPQIVGRSKTISVCSLSGAVALGGLAWYVHRSLPWVLCCIVFSISAVCMLRLQETRPTMAKPSDKRQVTYAALLKQTKRGFRSLFRRRIVASMIALSILNFSYMLWSWGAVRILMGETFGYGGDTFSYVLGGSLLVTALLVFKLGSLQSFLGDRRGLLILFSANVLAWSAALLADRTLLWGAVIFVTFATSGKLGEGWASIIINKQIASQERATALSVYSLLQQFSRLCGAVYFVFAYSGQAVETVDVAKVLEPFYLFMSFLLLIGAALAILSGHAFAAKQKVQHHIEVALSAG